MDPVLPESGLDLNPDADDTAREAKKRKTAPKKYFICDWDGCEREFGRPGILKIHKLTHTGERSFVCDFPGCDKAFAQSGTLVTHKRTHTNERPFKCDHEGCDAAFAQSSALTMHKRIHSGERPFLCDHPGCDKAFVASGDLTKHKRTHTDERPFVCDFPGCDNVFAQRGNLARHKRIHSGERPFLCDYEGCDAAFAQSGHLTEHKRMHTGERPFFCDFPSCNATFVRSGHLNVHKLTHSNRRSFKCTHPGCDAAFVTSRTLDAHATVHTPQGKQRRKLQEQAMHEALVMGGYTQSFDRGRVPPPGQFTREVYFDHRCALARNFMPGEKRYAYVDFVVTTPDGRVVFLEVDENQHSHESQLCETTRMWNILQSIALADLGGDINVFWLRANPNTAFRVGGGIVASPRKDRFVEVVKFLDALKSAPEDPPMQVGYAFYDSHPNGQPLVLDDPEFHDDVKPAVVCISKGSHRLVQPQPFAPVNPLFGEVNWAVNLNMDD